MGKRPVARLLKPLSGGVGETQQQATEHPESGVRDAEVRDQQISDYDKLNAYDWAMYEFATIEYDYKIHPDAARRIVELFKQLYAAEG